jgi:hypothetical protein
MSNIILTLDDIKPERLVELYMQKQETLSTKYKAKFIEGQKLIETIGYYLEDVLEAIGLGSYCQNANHPLLKMIYDVLINYPDTYSYNELQAHFQAQGLYLIQETCDSLDELVNWTCFHLSFNNNTDDEIIEAVMKTQNYKDGVVFYNNSYTHNIKTYNLKVNQINNMFIKIGNKYDLICYGHDDYDIDSDEYAISNGKPRYYIRPMPDYKNRISTFIKMRKKLLVHMNNLPHTFDYNDYVKKIIRLLDRSIYGSFELKWFDYVICEAIYGRFFKLYEVYVKN